MKKSKFKTIACLTLLFLVVTVLSTSNRASATLICDFEEFGVWDNPDTHGMTWSYNAIVNDYGGGHNSNMFLQNNSSKFIQYTGPAIESLWMTGFTASPADKVYIMVDADEGQINGTIVDTLHLTLGWSEYYLGGLTDITFVPYHTPGTINYNFGGFKIDDLNGVNPVPEPATVALLGIGLAGLAGAEVRRRRKKKAVSYNKDIIYQ